MTALVKVMLIFIVCSIYIYRYISNLRPTFKRSYSSPEAAFAQSVWRLATGRTTGFRFLPGAENFFLRHRVHTGSEAHPANSPVGTRVHSLGVKRPGCEADHATPSSTIFKIRGAITPVPQYAFLARRLVKHRDNFTFTFHISSCNILLI
jgi:hypothetical protein